MLVHIYNTAFFAVLQEKEKTNKKLKIYYEFYNKSVEIFFLLWYTYIEFLYHKAKSENFEILICRKRHLQYRKAITQNGRNNRENKKTCAPLYRYATDGGFPRHGGKPQRGARRLQTCLRSGYARRQPPFRRLPEGCNGAEPRAGRPLHGWHDC